MKSTCPSCGSRIAEGENECLACLLFGAIDDPAGTTDEITDPGTGSAQVSGYEIIRRIGMGGTANVYLARQLEPIEREVALKLIRPGMASERVVARFESEREVLAMLRHPHIASIFDAGQTGGGRPFFVMEYVEGVPVTQYAAREALSLEERLRLFVKFCDAVTHAHQKGVVHRDLKPSNLLVDDTGQPKVIDFGIARALEEGFGDQTLFLTQEGEILGTPAYMSPEQALGQLAEIDTRSDVFSLGAVLYELLTGLLPVDLDRLRGASPMELQRILTETDFQRPSLREATTRIPTGAIRGDLDWIVMKSLDREKERRYGSAAALAEDIGRHLANEPVSAGPPTVGYRLRKLVRRNRALVAGSTVVVLALFAGTGLSLMQANRARAAEREALAQAEVAETERKVSEAINQFFIEDLLGIDLRNTARPDVTLHELVEVAAARTEERFANQPKVARAVEKAIGGVYDAVGDFEKAEASFVRSREHNQSLEESAERDLEELQILQRLALTVARQGRTEEERGLWEEWEVLAGRIDVPIERLLRARSQQALMLADESKGVKAAELMRELLPQFETHFGPAHRSTLILKLNLGRVLLTLRNGDLEEPIKLIEDYVEGMRPAGETVSLAEAIGELGSAYAMQGRSNESSEAFDECLRILDKFLGPEHPSRLAMLLKLANAYRTTGRHGKANETFVEIYNIGHRAGGKMPLESLVAGKAYAESVLGAHPAAAKGILTRVVTDLEERGAASMGARKEASFQLAVSMWLSGEKDGAVARMKDELKLGIESYGESDPWVLSLRKVLMQFEIERGRLDEAIGYARAAVSAPLPTDEIGYKNVVEAATEILERVAIAYQKQPDVVIDLFKTALTNGYKGLEVWLGLGGALYERYRAESDLRYLRLSALCLIKAGRRADEAGVNIIREWIDEDELASTLEAPKFLIDDQTEWSCVVVVPNDPAWRRGGFDAGDWTVGKGEIGYGDGDEDTRLEDGEDPNRMPVSAGFRLEYEAGKRYGRPLVATVSHDNGAVVYIDGQEVYRMLMPPGDPTPQTVALGIQPVEAHPRGFAILPELLALDRPVVIAVQVHQAPHDAGDLSFAFSLAEPLPALEEVISRIPPAELKEFFGEVEILAPTNQPTSGKGS